MSWSINADGRLDRTHQWQNSTDKGSYERAFWQTPEEEQRMALAAYCADPSTPNDAIRKLLTNPYMPPRRPGKRTVPGITDILDITPVPPQLNLTDFTGTQAGIESSSRPSLGSV